MVNNFDKKLHFKIYYWVLDLTWVVFQIYIIDLFFSLLIFLKTNCRWTLHTNVCSRYILELLHQVWDLSKFDNRYTMTMVNFGKFFALFLGAFTVDFLLIANAIKCYLMAYLCRTPNRRYIYGSSCKTSFCNSAID